MIYPQIFYLTPSQLPYAPPARPKIYIIPLYYNISKYNLIDLQNHLKPKIASK